MYGNKSSGGNSQRGQEKQRGRCGDKAKAVCSWYVCCEALLYLQLAQYARLVHLRGDKAE
jgi:hypothetical protein